MALPAIQQSFRNVEDIDFAVDFAYAGDPEDFAGVSWRATLASADDPSDVLDFTSDAGADRRIGCEVSDPDDAGLCIVTFTFYAHWRLQQGRVGTYAGALLKEDAPHAQDVAAVSIVLAADPTWPRKS